MADDDVVTADDLGEDTPEVEAHDGFVSDEQHRERIGVQHKRFRDEERGRKKERDRADVAEAALDTLRSKHETVVIPSMVDPYSATYEADVLVRDTAIAAQAEQKLATESTAALRKEKDEARLAADGEALNARVATFDKNLVSHGLDTDEVKAAAETFIGFGISGVFQDIILDDKDGPLFVKYLAANPIEAEEINGMSTLDLVNHLNSEIRPKALLLKPQTSDAPDPPIVLKGGGAPITAEPWEKGARYE